MNAKKYYTENDLCCSVIYGGGIYEWTGQLVQDPLGGSRGEESVSPLLVNLITDEQFFLKRVPARDRERYRKLILSPPQGERILWPGDMVHLEEKMRDACGLFAAQEYTSAPTPMQERDESEALLFPYGGYPRMENALRRLSQISTPSWKSQEIRDMVVEIARALEDLNRSGYIYTDIHLSRLYFMDEGQVFLDFSNLIFPAQDRFVVKTGGASRIKPGTCPVEFAEPALVQGLIPHMDIHTQNFSLCALFFYLFLKRYPYDGQLLTGYPDDTVQQHYIKFRDYHKMPAFIFDPDNGQNSLGEFWEEQQVVELWNELPEALKEIFVRTLRQENAERTGKVNNPTPSAWLRCFQELGWCEEKGRPIS